MIPPPFRRASPSSRHTPPPSRRSPPPLAGGRRASAPASPRPGSRCASRWRDCPPRAFPSPSHPTSPTPPTTARPISSAWTKYFQPAERRPAEIADCAALIRYAYREALRAHDGNWATDAHLALVPAIPSVTKYRYPYTPLGADLFRVKACEFQPADLTTGAFAQFADAKTLELHNTHFIARDLDRAQPGDLLFYRQASGDMPFHSMIYLGASQIAKDAGRYLVYPTGPDAVGAGEIRRPTLDDLRRFPEPDWRPLPDNPRFLGVYRWNILRQIS